MKKQLFANPCQTLNMSNKKISLNDWLKDAGLEDACKKATAGVGSENYDEAFQVPEGNGGGKKVRSRLRQVSSDDDDCIIVREESVENQEETGKREAFSSRRNAWISPVKRVVAGSSRPARSDLQEESREALRYLSSTSATRSSPRKAVRDSCLSDSDEKGVTGGMRRHSSFKRKTRSSPHKTIMRMSDEEGACAEVLRPLTSGRATRSPCSARKGFDECCFAQKKDERATHRAQGEKLAPDIGRSEPDCNPESGEAEVQHQDELPVKWNQRKPHEAAHRTRGEKGSGRSKIDSRSDSGEEEEEFEAHSKKRSQGAKRGSKVLRQKDSEKDSKQARSQSKPEEGKKCSKILQQNDSEKNSKEKNETPFPSKSQNADGVGRLKGEKEREDGSEEDTSVPAKRRFQGTKRRSNVFKRENALDESEEEEKMRADKKFHQANKRCKATDVPQFQVKTDRQALHFLP